MFSSCECFNQVLKYRVDRVALYQSNYCYKTEVALKITSEQLFSVLIY